MLFENHCAACLRLISLWAPSTNHWDVPSSIISNRPAQEKLSMPLSISSELIAWPGALSCRNIEASARAKEEFRRWTGILSTPISAERQLSGGTIVRVVFFSAARSHKTSIRPASCGTENAGASALKIPALCQAMFLSVGPSCLTWSIPREVIPVTVGLWMTLVTSYSPPWWVSNIAASTFSLMNTWKANKAKHCRYRGCFVVSTSCPRPREARPSHTSKKYCVKRSSDIGWLSICILSRTHCKCGEVYSPIRFGNPVLWPCAWRNDRVNAQVLPLPLVPATWMTLMSLTSLS